MLSYQDNLENPQEYASGASQLDLNIQSELDHWQKLIFSFDMDERHSANNTQSQNSDTSNERGNRSRSHSIQQQGPAPTTHAQTSVQDAVLLAQFAAAAGLPETQPAAIHDPSYAALLALLNAQRSHPTSSTIQLGPPSDLAHLYDVYAQGHLQPTPGNMNWPMPPNSQQLNQIFGSQMHLQHTQAPISSSNVHASTSTTSSPSAAFQARSSASSSSSPTAMDANDAAITEDKRRRNTAASARFRIKKKQRNLNLERTVSDLTGRADELEREAADLRRENGWLKEIVILKGSRLAGLDVSPHTLSKLTEGNNSFLTPSAAGPSGSTASSSRPRQESEPEESDSSDEEYKEGGASKASGKGKGKKK